MTRKLTVILPVFNGMPYLSKAVDSILNQSFDDFTFMIVNDGSTDGSDDYLRGLRDPRIILLHQLNAGQGAARNAALHRCQTEFAAVMDQDDHSMPDRLLAQITYLESNRDVVLLGTRIEFLIGDTIQRALTVPLDHAGIEARLLKGRAGICHPSLMYRTSAAIACGGYPNGVLGEDIDFCLRMMEHGRAANLDQVLFQYRLHVSQASFSRCKDLVAANHYAASSAICRRKSLPVPDLKTFLRNASSIRRWRWSAEAWELTQYRTARILMATGKPISGLVRLAFLGICRPYTTFHRIAHRVFLALKHVWKPRLYSNGGRVFSDGHPHQ